MRDHPDRSLETLRRKLEAFEAHLKDLWKVVEAAKAPRSEIKSRIVAAESAVKRIEGDALAARARMSTQEEERALADSGEVEAWKRDGEVGALRSRAEDAEAYAAWSLIVATRAIGEVELATLKTIVARMDLESGSTQ